MSKTDQQWIDDAQKAAKEGFLSADETRTLLKENEMNDISKAPQDGDHAAEQSVDQKTMNVPREDFDNLQVKMIAEHLYSAFKEGLPDYAKVEFQLLDAELNQVGYEFTNESSVYEIAQGLWAQIKPTTGKQDNMLRLSFDDLYVGHDIGAVKNINGISVRVIKQYNIDSDTVKYRADVAFRFRWDVVDEQAAIEAQDPEAGGKADKL